MATRPTNFTPAPTAPPATGLVAAPVSETVTPTPLSTGLPTAPSFDVIEALPERAAEKLRMLRQRAADAHAVIPEFEVIRQASMTRIEAKNSLKRLTSHAQDHGFNLPEDDPRVVAAEKHLAKVTDDLRRLQERSEARSLAWQSASAALAAC